MEKVKPLLSVVMPVYNAGTFLERSLRSVLNQSFEHFEFIIVDDNSTDGSYDVLKKWSIKDKRIRLFRNKTNKGNWFSRDSGIRKAKANIIITQDADDISRKDRFEKIYKKFLVDRHLVCVGSNIATIDEFDIILGMRKYPVSSYKLKALMHFFCPFAHPTISFKRNEYLEIGGYNGDLRVSGDLDFYFRLAQKGRFGIIDQNLVGYRIHQGQITNKKLADMEKTANKIRFRFLNQARPLVYPFALLYIVAHKLSLYLVSPQLKKKIYEVLR